MNRRLWNGTRLGLALTRAGLSGVVLLGLLFLVARPSRADDPIDRPLELFYERLVAAVEWQANYLEVAEKLEARAQEWLDDLASKGQDTSELESALEAFKARLEKARQLHDKAVAILEEHEGFDDDGKVVDRAKALKTLMQAARALRDAQLALWRGTMDLRGITGDWRRRHQPWLFDRR